MVGQREREKERERERERGGEGERKRSGRLIAVGEVVIAFTRMQLRGFNDDATRLIAFIFARDTYVMKKTMGRENGGEMDRACSVAARQRVASYRNFFSRSTRSFTMTAFSTIKIPVVTVVVVVIVVVLVVVCP